MALRIMKRELVLIMIGVFLMPILLNYMGRSNPQENNNFNSYPTTPAVGSGQYDIASLSNISIGAVTYHGERNILTYYPEIVNWLVDRGATVNTISNLLTSSLLSNYNILWFEESGNPLSSNELLNLKSWVQNGGSILLMGDNGGSYESVASEFSVSFLSGSYAGTSNIIKPHAITEGVGNIYFSAVQHLDLSSQPSAVSCVEMDNEVLISALEHGDGKIVFISDEHVFEYYSDTNNNSLFINNTFGWLSSTPVNEYAPILSDISFTPNYGTTQTLIEYSVNFTDLDNNAPESINLHVASSIISLVKENTNDQTYDDGCVYNCLVTHNYSGSTTFYFSTTDGFFSITTNTFSGPTIYTQHAAIPSLSDLRIEKIDNNEGYYKISIEYHHDWNNDPTWIYVYRNGEILDTMYKENNQDSYYADGCTYSTEVWLGDEECDIMVECSDGAFTIRSTTYELSPFQQSNLEFIIIPILLIIGATGTALVLVASYKIKSRQFTTSQPVTSSATPPSYFTTHSTNSSDDRKNNDGPIIAGSNNPGGTREAVSVPEAIERSEKWLKLMQIDTSRYWQEDGFEDIKNTDLNNESKVDITQETDITVNEQSIETENELEEISGENVVKNPEQENNNNEIQKESDNVIPTQIRRAKILKIQSELNEEQKQENEEIVDKMINEIKEYLDEPQEQLDSNTIEDFKLENEISGQNFEMQSNENVNKLLVKHKKIEKEPIPEEIIEDDYELGEKTSLKCTSCDFVVEIRDLNLSVLYYCRNCKKEMMHQIMCPSCNNDIQITQDEYFTYKDSEISCPVCWEKVKL